MNILLLVWFKVESSNLISAGIITTSSFNTSEKILLPLAISFVTFQQISFLVDSYKQKINPNSFLRYCLFIIFFPQLLVGPIVRFKEMEPQFKKKSFYRINPENISIGLVIFSIGLFKKVILADTLAPYSESVYSAASAGYAVSFFEAWVGVLAFSFQIYFDFSGYSDMAIGIARIFNINLPINFDSPYRAVNRFDMWQRWHITLTRFMRQYVFMPLSRNKRFSMGQPAALFVTTVLGGFWHGIGWTFVIWGSLHGVLLLGSHYMRLLRRRYKYNIISDKPLFTAFRVFYTYLITAVLSIFFRAQDMAGAINMLKGICGFNGYVVPIRSISTFEQVHPSLPVFMNNLGIDFGVAMFFIYRIQLIHLIIMAIIIWFAPNTQKIMGSFWKALEPRNKSKPLLPSRSRLARMLLFKPNIFWALISVLLIWLSIINLGATNRFIYYQF